MTLFHTAPVPIRSVLIANRGEIATRIIRTCRRLGLRSIAVFSEADADALHVRQADDAISIGPSAAARSYLDIDKILVAARQSGADAVHPGYGFLSENAAFAKACEDCGLTFIGPTSDVIRRMGSKIVAKEVAIAAGVPTVPGFQKTGATAADFQTAAEEIGFPVLIKASSGGGGRGMRRVDAPQDLPRALQLAAEEARSAFNDGALLLEKLIETPRHLEVQICGDTHGNIVHLHERDCSVQRNNQKVLEEAPAPNLPDPIRARLHKAAIDLSREMGYHSAGTVEFILAPGEDVPYFLEVNTRLQVEHPVTEEVTGVDLVEWQLRVAAGLTLPLAQDEIRVKGHAIEARLAAERPDADFAPELGTLLEVSVPPGLRFDTGVGAGSEVSPHYDSMIAKLVAFGPDRASAVRKLADGLERMVLLGLGTNQRFLADCVQHPEFAEGRATTGFLTHAYPDGWHPDPQLLLRARGLAALSKIRTSDDSPLLRRDGFRLTAALRPARISMHVEDGYGTADLELLVSASGLDVASGDLKVRLHEAADLAAPLHGCRHLAQDGQVLVSVDGLYLHARVAPAVEAHATAASTAVGAGAILAPLPGLITSFSVTEGQRVGAGDPIVTMEAMKLVHSLSAPFDGVVSRIHFREGDTVPAKALLLELEE